MSDGRITYPKAAKRLLRLFLVDYNRKAVISDLEEEYEYLYETRSPAFAKRWYWKQVIGSVPHLISHICFWSLVLSLNYVKVSLRNIRRHRIYSFINLSGLALGIACCLLIYVYISIELGYEDHIKSREKVFRINTVQMVDGRESRFARSAAPLAVAMKNDLPEIESTGRCRIHGEGIVKHENDSFREDLIIYGDTGLLELLEIRFLAGESDGALDRPATVVLTSTIADRYFRGSNPVGEAILVGGKQFEITGIVVDPPRTTHLKYGIILSFNTLDTEYYSENWGRLDCYTYVGLNVNADIDDFRDKLRSFADRYMGELFENGGFARIHVAQPLQDIHLDSGLMWEPEPPGSRSRMIVMAVIALLILLTACVNYMNLSTARYAARAKEVGLRKTLGADRRQLVVQFMGESLFMSFLALVIASFLTVMLLPLLQAVTGVDAGIPELLHPGVAAGAFLITFFSAVLAGSGPAIAFSACRPATVLKGRPDLGPKGVAFRRALVAGQFMISALLILCTISIYDQIDFMKRQDLGVETGNRIVIDISRDNLLERGYENLKGDFLARSGTIGASACSSVPGRGNYRYSSELPYRNETRKQHVNFIAVDFDYVPLFGLEILQGRSFRESLQSDAGGVCLLNEAAVSGFGIGSAAEAIGMSIDCADGRMEIVGVIEDYHYEGLQGSIEPLVLAVTPRRFDTIVLQLEDPGSEAGNSGDLSQSLGSVREVWAGLFPDIPFEYEFIDDGFMESYAREERDQSVVGIFTVLCLIIAGLGLAGLAAYMSEQRTKEIGIRKAMGASTFSITLMMVREFMKWVVVGVVIALPPAILIREAYLRRFAVRVAIDPWMFAGAVAAIIAVAVAMVICQTYRAAKAEPIESLRYE